MKAFHILFLLPGALILLAMAAGLFPRARRLRSWMRWSCLLLSVVLVAWGTLSYLLEFERTSFSDTEYWAANHIKYWLGGIVVGIFVTLLISGEFVRLGKGAASCESEPKPITEHKSATEVK